MVGAVGWDQLQRSALLSLDGLVALVVAQSVVARKMYWVTSSFALVLAHVVVVVARQVLMTSRVFERILSFVSARQVTCAWNVLHCDRGSSSTVASRNLQSVRFEARFRVVDRTDDCDGDVPRND